jgi:hypothetical protein
MKILVCRECGDWVKILGQARYCKCGRSGGCYLAVDAVIVKIWGPSFVVGIKNSEFPHKGEGTWRVLNPEDPESHVEVG